MVNQVTYVTYLRRPCTNVCPNLKAAAAKLFMIVGFTVASYLD